MPVLGNADPRSLAPELLLVALVRGSGLVINSIVFFAFAGPFELTKAPNLASTVTSGTRTPSDVASLG